MNDRALARPEPQSTCLLCGGPEDDADPSHAPGRFRCQVCRSINGDDIAPWPESGSLVLPPVQKPRWLSASARATTLAPGSPFRRDGAGIGARVVVRWWVRPHGWQFLLAFVCVLVSGPFVGLFGPGLDLMGWIFSGCFCVLAYWLATSVERATLVVENGLAELVISSLPWPRWRPLGALSRPRRSVFRLAGPEHVYLRRRVSHGQEAQKAPECYYDLLVMDDAGRMQIIGGFADLNEARFVYQVMTGFVPAPEESSSLAPLTSRASLALNAPDEADAE